MTSRFSTSNGGVHPAVWKNLSALVGLLAICGLCGIALFEFANSPRFGSQIPSFWENGGGAKANGGRKLLLTVPHETMGPWIMASEAELDEMACLIRVATKALKEEGTLTTSQVIMSPELTRDPELPMMPQISNPGNFVADSTIDVLDYWVPRNPAVLAATISRRISKTTTPGSAFVPLTSYQKSTKSRAGLAVFLKTLKEEVNDADILPEVAVGSETTDVNSALEKIQQLVRQKGKLTVLALLGGSGKEAQLERILEILGADRFAQLRGNSTWIHPNAFTFVQSLQGDDDSSGRKQGILATLDEVGFATTLSFPTTNFTYVQLRKFKYVLNSNSCNVSSVQRAVAFVDRLKRILSDHFGSEQEKTGSGKSSWEAWNVFVAGRRHRDVVEAVQDSPLLIDETLRVSVVVDDDDDDDRSGGPRVERSELGAVTSEVVRRDQLLEVYAPAVLEGCNEPRRVSFRSRDPFTLNDVEKIYHGPKDVPLASIIPSNHGLVVSITCALRRNKADNTYSDSADSSVTTLKEARITCSGDVKSPCVHSAFTTETEKSLKRRIKRGIMEARTLLAALDAHRSSFPVTDPLLPSSAVPVAAAPLNGVDLRKRMMRANDGRADSRTNDEGVGASAADNSTRSWPPAENGGQDQQGVGNNSKKISYRTRQKAALIYKVLYEQGLNSDQMLKALPAVIADPLVRQETERLVRGLPDTRMLQAISSRQGAPGASGAPKKPKYPLPPYAKWLLGSLGAVSACLATSSGALLCGMIAESAGFPITVAACHQGGMMHVGGSCSVMVGRLMQSVADDNSVICTALHSQGLLDDFSFAVDSAFGRKLAEEDPLVLEGYHLMAKPVVRLMHGSRAVSRVMQVVSRPWIDQMMFESGYSEKETLAGRLTLVCGIWFARTVATIWKSSVIYFETFSESIPCSCLLALILCWVAALIVFQRRKDSIGVTKNCRGSLNTFLASSE